MEQERNTNFVPEAENKEDTSCRNMRLPGSLSLKQFSGTPSKLKFSEGQALASSGPKSEAPLPIATRPILKGKFF